MELEPLYGRIELPPLELSRRIETDAERECLEAWSQAKVAFKEAQFRGSAAVLEHEGLRIGTEDDGA